MFADYAALIVLLPVLAFVITLFFGKKLPIGGAPLPIAAIAGSFIISLGLSLRFTRTELSSSQCIGFQH